MYAIRSYYDYIDYNKSRAALKYKDNWGIYNADTQFPSTEFFHLDAEKLQVGSISCRTGLIDHPGELV